MAYTLSIQIVLGTSQAGLTLSAQLVDTTGANVGTAITTGFVDLTLGNYLWTYASFADTFRGAVVFSASSVVKASCSINPEATLNAAQQTSIADTLLMRDWTAMTLTGLPSRCMLNALRFLRNRWQIATGTLKVCDETDNLVSPAWTGVYTTVAGGNPVDSIDPA